jgi:hypothetical protein
MDERYLEVTFRKGKALAAYLYLPRPPEAKSVRTEKFGHGLIVDFDAEDVPIGVEITAPRYTSIQDINAVLDQIRQPRLTPDEVAPLAAA